MRSNSATSVGIFGGTFDPVHIGHLRIALELKESLQLDEMRLVPCAVPYHRGDVVASFDQRLQMVNLAVADESGLVVDDREHRRDEPSYTVDMLTEIRAELGAETPVVLCVGLDSLLDLPNWHRWQDIFDLGHLAVAARPGFSLPREGAVAELLANRVEADPLALQAAPAGKIFIAEHRLLPVSATELRQKLAAGESVRYLTPDAVIAYIQAGQFYQAGQHLLAGQQSVAAPKQE